MTVSVKIIAYSTSEFNIKNPLLTVECRYPRMVHAEMMTHRDFSRNAASSRAIPIHKMIADIKKDMAMPVFWGKNQSGMQAKEELTGWRRYLAEKIWRAGGHIACFLAWSLYKLGLHKQISNRILEPWGHITLLVTSSHWANFFALRMHPDAQPEIRELAEKIFEAKQAATPEFLKAGEWHLPYVTSEDRAEIQDIEKLKQISLARCASVSYKTVDGKIMTLERAIALGEKLLKSNPLHASPAEHQASPDFFGRVHWANPKLHGNFTGWIQNRKTMKNEYVQD